MSGTIKVVNPSKKPIVYKNETHKAQGQYIAQLAYKRMIANLLKQK